MVVVMPAKGNEKVDLTISIVNWNTCQLLRDCLLSIERSTKELRIEVIVVDNNSSDGSQEMVRREFPSVILIENDENRGFGAANNQALRRAGGEYVMLLNSDTVLLDGALDRCIRFMKTHGDVGAVSPRIWLDGEKAFQCPVLPLYTPVVTLGFTTPFGRHFGPVRKFWRSNWKLWLTDEPLEVDGIVGAAFIMPAKLMRRFGYMDEHMFMYFEDQELSRRVKKADLRCFIVSDADMIHYFNKSGQSNPEQEKIFRESMTYYYRKHYGLSALLLLKAGVMLFRKLNRFYPFFERNIYRVKTTETVTVSFENAVLDIDVNPDKGKYLLEIAIDFTFVGTVGTIVQDREVDLSPVASPESIDREYFFRYAPLGESMRPNDFTYGRFRVVT
jgi:hypothetical protein